MNWPDLMRVENGKEPIQGFESRSAFERDFDRIIFSHPFRKMQDKTQVVPMPDEDFVHTRLTHSLEVSSVARSLGKMTGLQLVEKYPELRDFTAFDFGAVCAAAALTHDIGNPPFGHSGETAISRFFQLHPKGIRFQDLVSAAEWADLVSFEGNAQGFRLLNKSGQSALKLTFPTLAAFTKYPCISSAPKTEEKRRSRKKFGFYHSELPVYQEIASVLGISQPAEGAWLRHPLAFLVEAADDVCYLIIDLEDGCRMGLLSFEEFTALLSPILGERFKPEKLKKIASLNEKLGVLRAMAINKLIEECVEVFMQNETQMRTGAYDRSLTDDIPAKLYLEKIAFLSVNRIYKSKSVVEREITGYKVLEGLLELLSEAVWQHRQNQPLGPREKLLIHSLPDAAGAAIIKAPSHYEALREMLDFISGLTDTHAIKLYRKWFGM